MTLWPSLVLQSTKVHQSSLGVDDPEVVIQKTVGVMNELSTLDDDMNDLFWRQGTLTSKPREAGSLLTSVKLEVTDPGAAALLCHVSMYSVVVCRILLALVQNRTQHHVAVDLLRKQMVHESRRIWMLLDYARANKPLGLVMMPAALCLTYSAAPDAVSRQRILELLDELDSARTCSSGWDENRVVAVEKFLLGEYCKYS
jgi:hypothetical protein